jgi:branched-chain amino acid transport system substrate-binding protein
MRRLAVAGTIVAALFAAGCGSSASSSSSHASSSGAQSAASSGSGSGAATGKPFRLLFVGDLSGPTEAYGKQELQGFRAATAYWNAHGGIGGRKIVISTIDDGGSPTTAVSQLISWTTSHGKPDMVFPGSTATDTVALVPEVKRLNLLAIGFDDAADCYTHAQTTCPTFFAPTGASKYQEQAVANWMHQRGYKKVGLLVEEDAYSESEVPLLTADLKALGITPVTATFPSSAVDVTPELDKLKSADVRALFGAALGPGFGYIAAARKNLGLVPTLPTVFDESAGAIDLTKVATSAQLKNSWEETQRSAVATGKDPGRDDLLTAEKPYGPVSAVYLLAYEWDFVLAAHDAALQAGTTDSAGMIKALNNLDSKYVHDPLWANAISIKFSPSDHDDILDATASNVIVPSGPLVNGEVQAP